MRFPEFREEWKKTVIGKLCSIVGGGTPDTNNKNYWNGNIQWFTPSEIGKDKYVSASKRTISFEGLKNSSAKLLPPFSILLSSRATVGECSINQKECCTNQGFQSAIPNNSIVSSDFLYYRLLTHKRDFIRKACGSTFLEISAKQIAKINTYLPTRTEQDKIASLLSLIDDRISIQNKVIEKYETLIKALRHHLFLTIESEKEVTIADVLSYEQPTKYIVSDTEYSDKKDLTPVLTANKAFILGYTEETDGVYDKGPCIILDDFTLDSKIVDFPFKVKSSAIKILSAKTSVSLRYIYEYLIFLDLNTEEHKRHYIAEIEPMIIELPDEGTIQSIAGLFDRLDQRRKGLESDLQLLKSQKDYLLRTIFI